MTRPSAETLSSIICVIYILIYKVIAAINYNTQIRLKLEKILRDCKVAVELNVEANLSAGSCFHWGRNGILFSVEGARGRVLA